MIRLTDEEKVAVDEALAWVERLLRIVVADMEDDGLYDEQPVVAEEKAVRRIGI